MIDAAPQQNIVLRRFALIVAVIVASGTLSVFGGVRYGLLLLVGLGLGITLEALRFGFAGPWRAMILRRDPAGLLAQILAIALVSVFAFPLLASGGGDLMGAAAPIGWAMVGGAFVFGITMQLLLGCGSGTLVNAGTGNAISLIALPFFVIGSFVGAYGLVWWTNLGSLPVIVLSGTAGLIITLIGLMVLAIVVLALAAPGSRKIPSRLLWAAGIVAALAIINLVIGGQPWGVVYGLGLWGAKIAVALGADLSGSAFWSMPGNAARVDNSLLVDITSLTNIGLICGAFLVAAWKRDGLSQPLPKLQARVWIATIIAGFLLGFSARIAFGCNVGAFFSGISTGSLHGWVWFFAAFAGAFVGIRLRPLLGFEVRT